MADQADPIKQIPKEHEDIVRSTWSQLLGAEGNVQNLAVDLFKNLVKTQLGGGNTNTEAGAGNARTESQPEQSGNQQNQYGQGGNVNTDQLFEQLGGMAGRFLGTRRVDEAGEGSNTTPGTNTNSAAGAGGGGGNSELFNQLGGLASQFLRGQGGQPQSSPGSEGTNANAPGQNRSPSSGGSLADTLGGLSGLARQFGGGSAGGGGGGNIMQMISGLGGLAALANGLHDPGSLLSFFTKTPVAQDANNPGSSSRDIYKIIKNVIFSLLGSKLPAENFSENTEARGAWKNYLGVIANALRNVVGSV